MMSIFGLQLRKSEYFFKFEKWHSNFTDTVITAK